MKINTLVASGATLTVNGAALTTGTMTWDGSAETNGKFSITGGNAADTIIGGAGNDTIVGGTGADSITAGAGGDNLSGDDGDDLFVFTATNSLTAGDTVSGGAHTSGDTVRVDLTGSVTFTLDADFTGIETLVLNDQSDDTSDASVTLDGAFGQSTLVIDGSTLDAGQVLTVDASANSASETVSVSAGSGDDSLTGGAGDDTISGGAGADILAGNGGSDTFKIAALGESTFASMDVITDFSFGVSGDALDLSAVDGIGKVGYTTQIFDTLTDFTNYAKNTFTYIVSGEQQVVIGTVLNDGVYALSNSINALYWGAGDASSSLVRLAGLTDVNGISASNFVGETSVQELLSLTDIANVSLGSPSGAVLVGSKDTTGTAEVVRVRTRSRVIART